MGCTDTPGYNLPPCPPCPRHGPPARYGGMWWGQVLVFALIFSALCCGHLPLCFVHTFFSPCAPHSRSERWVGPQAPCATGTLTSSPFCSPPRLHLSAKPGEELGCACCRAGPCFGDKRVASSQQDPEEGLLHGGGPSSLRERHHCPAARQPQQPGSALRRGGGAVHPAGEVRCHLLSPVPCARRAHGSLRTSALHWSDAAGDG